MADTRSPEQGLLLSQLGPGDKGLILKVATQDAALARHLDSLGLLPQTEVEVEEVAPFQGPLLVRVGQARYALGQEVAARVYVQPRQRRHRRRWRGEK